MITAAGSMMMMLALERCSSSSFRSEDSFNERTDVG
jgi:hypothetical protein